MGVGMDGVAVGLLSWRDEECKAGNDADDDDADGCGVELLGVRWVFCGYVFS